MGASGTTQRQIEGIANTVALNPYCDALMHGTGGFRKLRYAGVKGEGKSGGMRVVYLFITPDGEVHLIDIFEKSEKENLSQSEKNELAKIAALLKK